MRTMMAHHKAIKTENSSAKPKRMCVGERAREGLLEMCNMLRQGERDAEPC